MKHPYLFSLFPFFAPLASVISTAGKQKYRGNNLVLNRVGIKFVIISAGKVYPEIIGFKKYSWFVAKEVTSHL